ncbi:MAG: ADP-ribosylglycohydrolase family protein [Clostridia bacterium]|nr:ADP-ribosylglycohydrolase family protein [Clostridia bacterium]
MLDSKNAIIGLAIADAMGVPLEFCFREKLQENLTTEMKGYGSHPVPKGSWSDDTSMTLCLIDAINKTGNIVPKDIADNFVKWIENAEFTPTGETFDVGRTCLRAILNYEKNIATPEECGEDSEYSNGNGSLMRISPMIYYCYSKNMDDSEVYKYVKMVSSITHKHEVSILGCYIYVLFGIELLKGKDFIKAYEVIKNKSYEMFSTESKERYARILENDISKYEMNDIKSSGYIVDTLEATFWSLMTTQSYNKAVIKAINLGEDTDTVGACVGALAGIYYGIESINENWKNDLIKYDYIEELCNKFNERINGGIYDNK